MSGISDQLYREGTKLAVNKQYSEALSVFNQVIDLDAKNEQAWVARGVVQTHLTQYNDAYRSFGEALKINPNNRRAKDNQDFVSQYIDLEMPKEIPMSDPLQVRDTSSTPFPDSTASIRQSPAVESKGYKSNYLLFGWLFIGAWLAFLGMGGFLVFSIISTILVYLDAKKIFIKHRESNFDASTWKPWEWAVIVLFLWIVGYPLYLYSRREIFETSQEIPRTKTTTGHMAIGIIAIIFALAVIGAGFSFNILSGGTSTPISSGSGSSATHSTVTLIPTTIPANSKPTWGDLELEESHWETGPYGNNYVAGTIRNTGGRTYSYVQVEINLYDKDGNQIGSTLANINNLEPYSTWKFQAAVINNDAVQSKIKDVRAL